MSDAQIFQILSIIYVAVGIGMLIRPGYYKKMFEEFLDNTAVLYCGGVGGIIVGYLIVMSHNTWTADLSIIITIIGWIALIKGLMILVWPKILIAISRAMMESEGYLRIGGIVITIMGLACSFLGFCPKSPI